VPLRTGWALQSRGPNVEFFRDFNLSSADGGFSLLAMV